MSDFLKDLPPDVRLYYQKHNLTRLSDLTAEKHHVMFYNITAGEPIVTTLPMKLEEAEKYFDKAHEDLVNTWSQELKERFLRNVLHEQRGSKAAGLMRLRGAETRKALVDAGFTWSHSLEGHAFWRAVANGERNGL